MTENNENEKVPELENMAPEDEVELICDACGEEFTLTKEEIDNGADVSFCPDCSAEINEEENADNEDDDEFDDDEEDDVDDDDDDDDDDDNDDEEDDDIL